LSSTTCVAIRKMNNTFCVATLRIFCSNFL